MACGWFLALLLASMPLSDVSDYRKFAICLPFEIGDRISLGTAITSRNLSPSTTNYNSGSKKDAWDVLLCFNPFLRFL